MLNKENGFTLPWRFTVSVDWGTSFAIAVLLATLLLVYSNSFHGEWHFDDFHTIVENPSNRLQVLTWDELRKSFYGPTYGTEDQHITRPLAYASFALNHFFSGSDIWSYHVVNFLIHVIAAVFLFSLIRLTLSLPAMRERYGNIAYPVALLSSFLWATSPLHVHAVSIVVQRMASLAGMATVMALYSYARARTAASVRERVTLAFLCGACALAAFATKENTAVLPITFWLYDLFFIQGMSPVSLRRSLKWAVLPLASVLLLGVLYTDLTVVRGVYESGVRPFSPLERLMTQGRVLFLYASLLLYPIPTRLMFLHDIEISRSLFDPWTTGGSIAGIVLLLLFAVLRAKKNPLFSFAILFFGLNHLVEGTVVPLELIYEHRNYIPSMFFFVPFAFTMVQCLDYFAYSRRFQAFMAVGLALLLAFQGYSTFERNDIVRSDVHLWLDNVRKAPNLSRPRINLARHYYEAGMINEAVEEWKKAEGLDRDTNLRQIGVASYNLGVYYLNQKGQLDKAEQQFDRALKRFPGYPPAIVGLAKIQLKKGQPEEASRLLQEHAPRHPIHVEMLNAYGLVHLKTGNERDALKAALRSIQLKPHDPQPWEISGEAWRRLGQPQKAIESWEEALRLNPANPTALLALVDLYDRTTRRADLARIAAQCLVLKGSTPLDAWLAERAANAGMSAYEVNPGRAGRIIRRELSSELSRSK